MKTQFGEGLFIKNDDNGHPCCIGDTVRVKVGKGIHFIEDHKIDLPEAEYEGILVLLKSKGVRIHTYNGLYIRPAFTKSSIRKWTWELIKSNQ